MDIVFHHKRGYRWELVPEKDRKRFAEDNARAETQGKPPVRILGQDLKGGMTIRVEFDSPTTTTKVVPGALEAWMVEREELGLPYVPAVALLAEHIQKTVIPNHFNPRALTKVTCEQDPTLAIALSSLLIAPEGK